MDTKDIEVKGGEITAVPERKLPRGKLPRNLQDRSKYGPHQGKREIARRLRQMQGNEKKDETQPAPEPPPVKPPPIIIQAPCGVAYGHVPKVGEN